MGLFDIFKRQKQTQSKELFAVAPIVKQMFDEAGITPQCPDENVFMTVIDGVHCSFKTILKCDDEENPNRLFIYAPFPVPVPKHIAGLMPHELNRLNENNKYESEISIKENNGEYSIFAFTDCEFEKAPTTDEVQALMIHTIDVMDNENFRSLICAIMGYATYDELEKAMIGNAQVEGNHADIQMQDGYCALRDKSNGVTSSRYSGRLLMFSTHIIEQKISQERARQLLEQQMPLLLIMQEAYNAADDIERDILRKLRYLVVQKNTASDNEADSVLGRLEAISMIEKDPYSLLSGAERPN